MEAANDRLVAALSLLKERYTLQGKNGTTQAPSSHNNNNNGASNGGMRSHTPTPNLLAELSELRSSSC
jgi:hypothetical protein